MADLLSYHTSENVIIYDGGWTKDINYKATDGNISLTYTGLAVAQHIEDYVTNISFKGMDSWIDLKRSCQISSIRFYSPGLGRWISFWGSNLIGSGYVLLGTAFSGGTGAAWANISVSDTNYYRYLKFNKADYGAGGMPISEIEVYGIGTGDVSISSNPSGARIWIDDIDKGVDTPNTIAGLSPGSHTYKLTLTGYIDSIGSFEITAGSITTIPTITLTPIIEIGYIEITSDPLGAEIYIDDQLATTTPDTLTLPIGVYNLRIHKEGYVDRTEIIIITKDFTLYRHYSLYPIVTGKGFIDIRSTPPGAKIYIDNILQIQDNQPLLTPVMIEGISIGSHNIKLTLPGYQYWATTVSVVENMMSVIDATLVQIAIMSTSIDISPGPYIEPSTITITVTWQNTGSSPEAFDPSITITKSSDGTTTHMNLGEMITLNPTESTIQIFTLSDLMIDIYTICPDPN